MNGELDLDLEFQVRAFLLATRAVTDIVADRVYPAPAPQNTPSPFVTFQRISVDRNYTIYGPDRPDGRAAADRLLVGCPGISGQLSRRQAAGRTRCGKRCTASAE